MHGMLEVSDVGFFVVVFVAIWLIGGDFPGERIRIDVKLG